MDFNTNLDPTLRSLLGGAGVCAFIGAIFLFIVVIAVVGHRRARAIQASWVAWAGARGVALTGHYPMVQITGTLHGVGVQVVTHKFVRRHNRRTSTSYKHEVIATPLVPIGDLTLSREGFFASIGKTFGGQDIQTGDPAFDAAFVVRSSNEHAARAVLTPTVCAALLEAQRALGEVHVESGGVRTMRQGTASPDTIDGLLDAVARAALAFGR